MTEEIERQPDEPEDESHWNWPDALAEEMFMNKDFLAFAERSVDKLVAVASERNEIQREQLGIDKAKITGWARVNTVFLWQRFTLSVLALIGLALGAWYRVIPNELIGTLLVLVVGSLFIQPRKD